ncbi:SdiA-regulated domain-containing protein [Persicobacter diffluens]
MMMISSFPFNLKQPNVVWSLPPELEEISGLCYVNSNNLAMVNDESGVIYIFNAQEGALIRSLEFKEKGDFEGITYHKSQFYVLRSDGKLYVVPEDGKGHKSYQLPFKLKNDLEGLTTDGKYLFIAPKGRSGMEGEKEKHKIIWRLSIDDLKQEPQKALKLKKSDFEEKEGNGYKGVAFSGLAIHPITSDFYVLSHRSKHLVVFSQEGALKQLLKLDKEVFPQPEAICFDHMGNLFIATEAVGKQTAKLYRFSG